MSSINYKSYNQVKNSVGTVVRPGTVEQQLKRVTLASMLWENQYYLDGHDHAQLVKDLVAQADPEKVSALALEARSKFKLRYVPLQIFL